MRTLRVGRVYLLATAAMSGVLIWSSAGLAQSMMTLDGSVRTRDGVPLSGVDVIVEDAETGMRRNARTGEAGRFRFVALSPGRYSVTTRMLGYKPATQAVQLVVGQSGRLAFTLEPGAVALDAVQVIAQQPSMEIQRSSVSFPVFEEEIRELPFSSRNVMELAAIAPGIRGFRSLPRPQTRVVSDVPSAGAFPEGGLTNLYVDGLPMKSLYDAGIVGLPQTGSPFPADALREFRVLLNPYDPEYSQAGVYIIEAVTHRGTNDRRGSAFGFFQNAGMVSITGFQRALPGFQRPDYARQKAGFNLRGPILPDRLFYALSYELSNTANFIHVIPDRPALNPALWDEYAGAYKAPNRNHTGLLRLTFAPRERHTIDGTWSARYLNGTTRFGERSAYESATTQEYAVHTMNLRHRWTPAARLANDLSLQFVNWAHGERALRPGPALQYPSIVIGRPTSYERIRERHTRVVNRTTFGVDDWYGSHLLKTGVEIERAYSRGRLPLGNQGAFEFDSDTATMPVAAMIGVGLLDPHSDREGGGWVSGWIAGLYVTDEWRPHSDISLNLGLRYDVELNLLNNRYTVPWVEDPELASIPELQPYLNRGKRKNDLNNLAPRISFSWDMSGAGRTFLRGGFGVIYDRVPKFAAFQERLSSTWRVYQFRNPGTTDPEALRQRVIAGDAAAMLSPVLLRERMETPFTRQWSLGIGRRLMPQLDLSVDFLHQEVRDLFARLNLNWLDQTSLPPRRALSSNYGAILVWDSFARARYRALLTRLAYQNAGRVRANVAYTLGLAEADWDIWPDEVPVDARDRFYVMQRTSGDERHRLVFSGMVPIPLGFTTSSIITLASPRPYKAIVGQDLNRNSFLLDDWIDGVRYRTPANTWSNWYRMVDVRLSRPLPLGQRARMALIVEAFNLFNSENYAGFSGQQFDRSGHEIESFGRPSAIFATRQFQLGARLDF